MEPPHAVFRPGLTVAETVERIRELVKTTLVTYGFVTDEADVLQGVVAMRDLLLAGRGDRLDAVMLRQPFSLRPEMPLLEAARLVVARHFPVYPVCDDEGRLVGIVRGRTLFEEQALEMGAEARTMVGVEKEERLSDPVGRAASASATRGSSSTCSPRSSRRPWSGPSRAPSTKLVVLAVFLPVLAGQSGNTGCQALAVTLRGLTLGELRHGGAPSGLVFKEGPPRLPERAPSSRRVRRPSDSTWCARLPGGTPPRCWLSLVVFLAMIGSCPRERPFRRPHPPHPEAPRRRPRDRLQHLPDHRDRRREHGPLPRPGHADRALGRTTAA